MFVCPYTFVCPQQPPYVHTPSYVPMPPVHLYVLRGMYMWYGDMGVQSVALPKGRGVPPQVSNTPTNHMLTCMSVCSRGYLHVLWGKLFLCWGSGGISTSDRLLGSVSTSIWCPLCFILYLSCSSLCLKSPLPWLWLLLLQWCGIFWYAITIIGDCGSLFDVTSYSIWSAWCSFVSTPDTKMLWRCSWPPSSMTLQVYANYAMGSPQVGFRVEPPTICILYVWSLFWCLLSTFRCLAGCHTHPLGAQLVGFAPLQPLGVYPWQSYVQPGDGNWPTPDVHRVADPSTTLRRGRLLLLSLLFHSHPI